MDYNSCAPATKNIKIIDKSNIHNNKLQVINQYEVNDGNYKNRYDVTILVNGLPLVHVELKRRGVALKEAFNQINRYQRDSFWAGCGLFQYVQIFVISNGTNTKYYSNTTRESHIKEQNKPLKTERTSNTFEFTSFWADATNKIIPDLVDFTRTFFAKHTLLNILTKYCVFTAEEKLLVMRPYQIAATEKILNRIEIATNYKKYGSRDAGGYIWHTTGSGKTLTSFKTARLASKLDYIDKVVFVVDRKDLDYQTMREYDRFEKGAANSNTSTTILKRQLEDSTSHIIITTIQKLSIFNDQNKNHPIYDKKVVLIFDECHRSQFGSMHSAIIKNFKKYYIFGFTGTPIFAVNSASGGNPNLKTTEQAFGDKLHTYTVIDAINDRNVLPFKLDYIKTMDEDEDIEDEQVKDINREAAYNAKERIALITKYIFDHFSQKTYKNEKTYVKTVITNVNEVARGKEEQREKIRLSGFNSILATSSIEAAKLYYSEFKRRNDLVDSVHKLKVALIYSYGANEDLGDGILDEENSEDTSRLDKSSRDFLEEAIQDYNEMFQTNFSTQGDGFQNYYRELSLRMKNRDIDVLIVVNMFLTGFDATTLNTLWVDKNLKMHGLMQAFSRTNRILNSIKTFGNIVCFRPLQTKVEEAISLFGDKEAAGIVLLKTFGDYFSGYDDKDGKHHAGYVELIDALLENFPLYDPDIVGEQREKEFLKLFGQILRMKNLLSSFDDFEGKEILSERDYQDYISRYLDLRQNIIKSNDEAAIINDDIVFEIELIRQVEVNIDYILMLVTKYHDSHCNDREVLISIQKAIDSSPELRSKKALIQTFVEGIVDANDVMEEWHKFIAEKKEKEIKEIIAEENLKEKETREFISNSLRDGFVKTNGTDLDNLLPPMSRFGNNNRSEKKKSVLQRILDFFDRFFGISEN